MLPVPAVQYPYHEWNVVVNMVTQHTWDWDHTLFSGSRFGPCNQGCGLSSWLLLQFMFGDCPFKHYVYCNHGKFIHLAIYTWTSRRCRDSKYCVHSLTASCARDVGIASVVEQYGVVLSLCYQHFLTYTWTPADGVHSHLTVFTAMFLMWASHTGRAFLFGSSRYVHFAFLLTLFYTSLPVA